MKKGFISIVFLFFLKNGFVFATTPGGQAGGFLRMGVGARPIAMGNAFTGLASGGFAGYYNPAGLPFMTYPELAFSFGNLPLDRSHNFVGFSTYLNPGEENDRQATDEKTLRAGLSLGWVNAGVSNIDARDRDGRHLGMYSTNENAFYFSFALRPLEFIAVGLSAKVVNNRFPKLLENDETLSATGFGMDVGLYAVPLDKLSLGVTVKDIKTKYTWNTEDLWERGTTTVDRFPTLFRTGAAYRLPFNTIVSADAEFNQEQGWRFYAGGEIRKFEPFVLRAGYNSDRVSFGFGLQFNVWGHRSELSYAYDAIQITPSAEQYFSLQISL